MARVTPFLMFNNQLEAAMEFYAATFPDSETRSVARTGNDGPITSAEFVVGGQVFMLMGSIPQPRCDDYLGITGPPRGTPLTSHRGRRDCRYRRE